MIKFKSDIEEKIFLQEVSLSNLPLEEYVLNRRKIEVGLADRKRSKIAKDNWKQNRREILKGIQKFHKSTDGKKFHRQLSRFLISAPKDKLVYAWDKERDAIKKERDASSLESTLDMIEVLIPLSSAFTHALIETYYYSSLDESVCYNLFLDQFIAELNQILSEGKVNWEFVIAIVSPKEWKRYNIDQIQESLESCNSDLVNLFLEKRLNVEQDIKEQDIKEQDTKEQDQN